MNLKFLKVKAKNRYSKEWVKGFYYYKKGDGYYIIMNDYDFPYYIEINRNTICRLVYKKGKKEIWENDIVEGDTYKESIAMRTKKRCRGLVKVSENKLDYYIDWKLPDGFKTFPNIENVTKIGNIFDNPELLKEV